MKAREDAAWRRFVHLYVPLIYRWCRKAGLQESDAEDVGQEVFRAVDRAIERYRHDRESDTFRGWLRTITQNKLRDFGRRIERERPGDGGSDALKRLLQMVDPMV